MIKKWIIAMAFFAPGITALSQSDPVDTLIKSKKEIPLIDTSINYDDFFQDFDAFMDSILSPQSYFLASVSMGKGNYNFETKTSALIESSDRLTYSPMLAYYHKSGFGLTAMGYIVNDREKLNFYQYSLSPSYDYLQNKKLAAGISYTKYITKDSLSFYTTPLKNELYAYFSYRKLWIRPTVAMSYGWGSRTDYSKQESVIQDLRLRRRGFTYINSKESVTDFSIMASLRHDFYWLDALAKNDHIRFTPQLSFSCGTQKFGFNQTSSTYATVIRTNSDIIYSTDNVYLDDQLKFQPLSLTFSLRGEYAIGRFFIQPQYSLDYYFPATSKKLTGIFSFNTGFLF